MTRFKRGLLAAGGIGLALLILFLWHRAEVRASYREGEREGANAAYARVEDKALKIAAEAVAVTAKIRSKTDEQSRAIVRDAAVIRVSGPGRAACPVATPARTSGPVEADRPADVAAPVLPTEDRAAVPWTWLVDQAEQCDLNRAEALAWREQRAEQVKAYEAER